MSLSRLIIDAYYSAEWLNKFDRWCIDKLCDRLLERFNVCNESTMGHIRIENHDALINNMNDVFDTHESHFLSELETHSEREDEMVLESLSMFLHECYLLRCGTT